MADEAFALSPISARATLPGEEDYAAISEAFMETSRGRWFLTEYAKRNRNADTSMVLDAVARIEQSLAAQKEDGLAAQREAQAAAAAADASLNEARLAEAKLAEARLVEARIADARLTEARLAEAMASIRHAIETAQASAVEALDALALNERLAPVRKGARVIREIAWRLREIGNDGRICDLINSQVSVIEKGAEQISSDEAKAALSAAFAAIEGRITEIRGEATPAGGGESRIARCHAGGRAGCGGGARNRNSGGDCYPRDCGNDRARASAGNRASFGRLDFDRRGGPDGRSAAGAGRRRAGGNGNRRGGRTHRRRS